MNKIKHLLQRRLVKKWVLCIGATVLLVVFFSIPVYKEWLQDKIIGNAADFTAQASNLDINYRMQNRFDSVYIYCKQIENLVQQKHLQNALILVPPRGYFQQYGINFHVPEPAIFYYFTGLKTVWYNCSDVQQANWIAKPVNGTVTLDSVTNKQALLDSIAIYRKYKIEL